ncbi:MAG: hypothetical protein ACPL4K_01470, partial [Candidatus Margulisiibacteriota bacterium]
FLTPLLVRNAPQTKVWGIIHDDIRNIPHTSVWGFIAPIFKAVSIIIHLYPLNIRRFRVFVPSTLGQ